MPGRRKEDVSLVRLEAEVHEAPTLANAARAEARGVRDDTKKDFKELLQKFEQVKDAISSEKIKLALDDKDVRRARWKSIGVVAGQVLVLAVSLILNWDRAEKFILFWHKAETTKVPLLLDLSKKPHRKRVKKKPVAELPPIVTPQIESHSEEHDPE